MRNTSVSTVRKILLLASVLILMLTLCGCRTRITNNDEVSNVMYDEEGYRQEEYNMRRDDLGLGKAPKPVFTGFGAPEEDYGDYDYGSDSQALEDYDPEAYEEPYEEPEEETTAGTSSSGSGGSGRVIRRNSSSVNSSKKSSSEVEIVLDANGGTINGKKSITVEIDKDGDYDALPSPDERDGYVFDGWFTKKDGGTNVGGKKLASTKKHKLYAHWTPAREESKKTYTVTLDANGGVLTEGNTLTAEEGGTYGTLPTPANAEGAEAIFEGWYTEKDGGVQIKAGDAFTANAVQTLYAHWDTDPLNFWTAKLNDTVSSIPEKEKITYSDCSKEIAEFLAAGGMKKGDGSYEFLIHFEKDGEAAAGDKPTIVIPEKALTGTDAEKLLYKYKLFNALDYDFDFDVTKIANKLGTETGDNIVILPAAEESAESGDEGGE